MTDTLTAPAPTALPPTTCQAFTLASALAWAGHACDGGCPPAAAQTPASLWFVRRSTAGSWWRSTLVVIDLGDSRAPAAAIRALLRDVERCARRDHIQIRERVATDQGHALAALSEPPATTRAALYICAPDPDRSPVRPRPSGAGIHGVRKTGRGLTAAVAHHRHGPAPEPGVSSCGW